LIFRLYIFFETVSVLKVTRHGRSGYPLKTYEIKLVRVLTTMCQTAVTWFTVY